MRRRLDGSRRISLVDDRCPTMSVSVSTASSHPARMNPCAIFAVVTLTTPAFGSSSNESTKRAGISSPDKLSTNRSAEPCPSLANTTRQLAFAHLAMSVKAKPASPRYEFAAVAPKSITSSSRASNSSTSLASGVIKTRGMERASVKSKISATDKYDAPARSIGVWFPTAALCHEAAKNSAAVRSRSWARVRRRSGSISTKVDDGSMSSGSETMPSTNTGIRVSMPSTCNPSAIRAATSEISGAEDASNRARSRTLAVSSNSRTGGANNPWWASSRDLWSATEKVRISSTTSPQNSTRSGCSSGGGKTSRIPPRTANCPRRSTKSFRS
ncbi:unannotated protein [freshwater metagenome]|uniref:Unannotated protein n=1 Tax=freshwater metagenome TaxID=449393 RepID=A0A6J7QG21_9ZZZZ